MYKIGSFNCLNFGMGASKDIQKIVDIILNEQFDIIALQEIKGQNALNRILKMLPTYWEGIADCDCNVNDYAFLWNSRRFELANTKKDGVDRKYAPRIYKQYRVDRKSGQRDLIREPFYARFFPRGGAVPYIEIRLINTHIRFSKGKESDDNSLGAVLMRKNEFDVLTKAIYAKEADKRYGNDRPAYTILLGDYNLNLRSSSAKSPYVIESFVIGDGKNTKVIATVQSGLSTLAKSSDDSSSIFSNNYDHFTYDSNHLGKMVVSCKQINTVEKYCSGNREEHIKEISDHVPVVMEINLRG